MAAKKLRTFNGLSYREVQQANREKRQQLHRTDQQWLKSNGYKNMGWEQVIALAEKIAEFLEKYQLEDLTLEDLFLEADRIGNKYQTPAEIADFNQQLAQQVNEISELVDQQFPDTEVEVIDFSRGDQSGLPKKRRL
jgi:phospholipase/lecithinase/hemolysin